MSKKPDINWADLIPRLLLSFFYLSIIYVLTGLALLIILLQWILAFARLPHLKHLDEASGRMIGYLSQMLHYVFFLSNFRPFPFNPLPPVAGAESSSSAAATGAVKVEVVTSRPAGKNSKNNKNKGKAAAATGRKKKAAK